jgi:hypothetical protein
MADTKVNARYLNQAELNQTGFGQSCIVIGRRVSNTGKSIFQASLLLPGNADHNDRVGFREGPLNHKSNPFTWVKQLSARRMFAATKCSEPYLSIEADYRKLIVFFKDMELHSHQAWISSLLPDKPKERTQELLLEQLAKQPYLPAMKPFDPFEL